MSKTFHKREQKKARSIEALDMFLNCHAKSWDRRERKAKERKNDWKKDLET